MDAAVLFDVDGVLVDSTPAYERAWRAWSEDHGVDFEPLWANAAGRRPVDIVHDALAARGHERRLALERFGEHIDRAHAAVSFMPGAVELLGQLPSGRFALVSSAPRQLVAATFARHGIEVPAGSVFAGDVERGKPDPACYLLGAARLGVAPERVLVVEDAPAGIRAGKAADMSVAAIASTYEAPALADADRVFPTLRDASEHVRAWLGA